MSIRLIAGRRVLVALLPLAAACGQSPQSAPESATAAPAPQAAAAPAKGSCVVTANGAERRTPANDDSAAGGLVNSFNRNQVKQFHLSCTFSDSDAVQIGIPFGLTPGEVEPLMTLATWGGKSYTTALKSRIALREVQEVSDGYLISGDFELEFKELNIAGMNAEGSTDLANLVVAGKFERAHMLDMKKAMGQAG